MNLNQLTIIGFIGRNAETKQLPNGTPITKFSVATTKSWKDDNGEWKNKTQWHTVLASGKASPRWHHVCSKALTFRARRTEHARIRSGHPGPERKEVDRASDPADCGRAQSRYDPHSRSRRQFRARQLLPNWPQKMRSPLRGGLMRAAPAPSCLRTLPGPFAFLFRADRRPIIPRYLSHGPAEHLRLPGLLMFLFRGRVPHLCFSEQSVESSAQGLVARQIALLRYPVQLLVKRIGGFQPHRPPRVIRCSTVVVREVDEALDSAVTVPGSSPASFVEFTAYARFTTRLFPSALIVAGHSGQSTRIESSHCSSFSRKRRASHTRSNRFERLTHTARIAEHVPSPLL